MGKTAVLAGLALLAAVIGARAGELSRFDEDTPVEEAVSGDEELFENDDLPDEDASDSEEASEDEGPLRATLGLSTGYDSNPEEEPDGRGSAFGRLDAGFRLSLGDEDATALTVEAEAAAIEYEGAIDPDHEYAVKATVNHRLNDALSLELGASYDRDATGDPESASTGGWIEAALDRGALEIELRGEVGDYREMEDRAVVQADDLEILDHRFAASTLRATIDLDRPVRPIFEGRIRRLDYLERRPGKPDRDALETSLLGGVSLASGAFELRLGLRRKARDFDDPAIDTHVQLGPEAELVWSLDDLLSVEVAYAQSFEEAESDEGLVLDRKEFRLGATYELNDRVTLGATASHATERGVGAAYDATVWSAGASARWEVRDNLALLAEGTTERTTRHDAPEESYTRTIARGGVEATF